MEILLIKLVVLYRSSMTSKNPSKSTWLTQLLFFQNRIKQQRAAAAILFAALKKKIYFSLLVEK